MREAFEETADQARQETLSYEQYLLELVNRECEQRRHKRVERMLKSRGCRWRRPWRSSI